MKAIEESQTVHALIVRQVMTVEENEKVGEVPDIVRDTIPSDWTIKPEFAFECI